MSYIPKSLAFDMLFGSNKGDAHETLSKIYDSILNDFKNRTCEKCKHKYVVSHDSVECKSNDSMLEYLDLDCYPTFGCNSFESLK